MSVRCMIGVLVLVGACVAGRFAIAADGGGNAAARRPLAFPITAGSADSGEASVECVVEFGPVLPISAVAFGPDGKTLAVGGYREVLLWDLEDAKLAGRIGTGQLAGLIHAVAFVDGGKGLAVGDGVPGRSGAVRIFDVDSGDLTAGFDEPQRVVCCLAVSPDGKLLAAGDAGSLVHVWNLGDNKLVKTIDAHNGRVLGTTFSADGKRLGYRHLGVDHPLRRAGDGPRCGAEPGRQDRRRGRRR